MGSMRQAVEKEALLRVLAYGRPLTRKTWWALKAAELGFNIVYCDFDGNIQIASQIDGNALDRIFRLDMRMPVDENTNNGALTLMKAVQGDTIYYDEQLRQYVPVGRITQADADRVFAKLDFSLLGPQDILVIDSWTAHQTNLAQTQRNITDSTSIEKPDRDEWGKLRLASDVFISNINKLNCHVIMIGHVESYVKRKADADPKKNGPETIDEIREQPISGTRAHGERLSGHFTDVLRFTLPKAGQEPVISTLGSDLEDAGSRSAPPQRKLWSDFQFGTLLTESARQRAKSSVPQLGATQVTGAEILAQRAAAKSAATINVPASGAVNILNRKPS